MSHRTHISLSGETAMLLLHEQLARERMREHERLVESAHQRRVLSRIAAARRLQRRAESASRRARALLLSV
jgi:hypothetical protein